MKMGIRIIQQGLEGIDYIVFSFLSSQYPGEKIEGNISRIPKNYR